MVINNGKKLAILGVLTGLAIIIGFVENMMPPIFAMLPYVRLGLANIVILLALVVYGVKESSTILIIKIIMLAIFSGNPSMALYSLCGGIFSIIIMRLLLIFRKNSLAAISAAGGVLHNFGQVCVAALIIKNISVFVFLPHLMLFGALAGIITGIVCFIIIKRLGFLFA